MKCYEKINLRNIIDIFETFYCHAYFAESSMLAQLKGFKVAIRFLSYRQTYRQLQGVIFVLVTLTSCVPKRKTSEILYENSEFDANLKEMI